jgi:eukaryotic-like serine/threonine-protein kinase
MADVFAAVDQRLQRDVAVKITRPGAAGSDDVEARFEDEARVAAGLQHPNVVAVFDTGTADDGRPFIVMERLPGDTLADRMRDGPLPDLVVRALADDVLAALASAHAAGIVHRDIKPGNILMSEEGHAKIADFGIARESDSLLVDPTTTNALTGTPAYIAPERIDGKPATARSDIWALGVVLYEALAGRKPFDALTPVAVALAVRDGKPTPLTKLRPGVDPVLAATVGRAMAPDPNHRFASAAEMAAALNRDPTVLLRVPPALRRVPRRTVAMVGALFAIALLIAIGLAVGRTGGGSDVPANPVSAQVTTTAAPTTTIITVVQPVEAPPLTARRRAKGKRGGND